MTVLANLWEYALANPDSPTLSIIGDAMEDAGHSSPGDILRKVRSVECLKAIVCSVPIGYDGGGDDYGGYGDGCGGDDDGCGGDDGGGHGYGGYGYGYGYDGGYGYGDGYGGYGYGYGYDGGYGYGYGYDGGDGLQHLTGINMDEGSAYIVDQFTGGTPYVIVGVFERFTDSGMAQFRGARCIRRYGSSQFLAGLAQNGPASDTQLGPPGDILLNPILIAAARPANKKAWGIE